MNSNQNKPALPRVLLAENDSDLGRIICVLLKRASFTVMTSTLKCTTTRVRMAALKL